MSMSEPLRFREGKPFRILQVTDTHYDLDDPGHAEVDALLEAALDALRPDLTLHTGDGVEPGRLREGWERLAGLCAAHGAPWAAVLGNHDLDPAAGLSHRGVARPLAQRPGALTQPGPERLPGGGTYALPIHAPEGSAPRFVLYCMDSQDASVRRAFPHLDLAKREAYGWFHPDQVAWFRATAHAFREANGGEPLPAAAFFLVPLTEIRETLVHGDFPPVGEFTPRSRKGRLYEAPVNTGMFHALLESRAVRCAFFGHAHDKDFAGARLGLGLVYGRYSGGPKRRAGLASGVRVIDIAPDGRSLDTFVWVPGRAHGPAVRFPNG